MIALPLAAGLLAATLSTHTVPLAQFGAAGQGSDDTRVFQSAIDSTAAHEETLVIPASPAPYQVAPLKIPSDSRIVLGAGAIVQATPGYKPFDRLLNIVNVRNVTITGTPGKSVFRMLKPEYTTGEYRHSVDIEGSSEVRIEGIAANDSGGDGLYIGAGKQGFSDHVTVKDSTFDNNRRQALSIVSGSDVTITHCRFTNSHGTGAGSGIDIEPNGPTDRVVRVRIEECAASGNAGSGLSMGLYGLNAQSQPVSVTVRHYASERNHQSGFFISGNDDPNAPTGRVVLTDCSSTDDADYGAVASFWTDPGPMLVVRNLTVTDANGSGKTYDGAAIAVKRGGGRIALGNVRFEGASIIDTKGRLKSYFSVRDYSKVGLKNIWIGDFRTLRGLPAGAPIGMVDGRSQSAVNIPP
jgi:hypothetical protein